VPGKAKKMPSTTTFRRGQVVVVNVPFTGQTGSKPRPALVVSVEAFLAEELGRAGGKARD
jgi:hypothetical protein